VTRGKDENKEKQKSRARREGEKGSWEEGSAREGAKERWQGKVGRKRGKSRKEKREWEAGKKDGSQGGKRM
jgi:hypothetical protein